MYILFLTALLKDHIWHRWFLVWFKKVATITKQCWEEPKHLDDLFKNVFQSQHLKFIVVGYPYSKYIPSGFYSMTEYRNGLYDSREHEYVLSARKKSKKESKPHVTPKR